MTPCPVCGKANGACGDQPLVFPPIAFKRGPDMADKKIYVPKQHTKRGVAGYYGKNVVVVDPATQKETPAKTTKA